MTTNIDNLNGTETLEELEALLAASEAESADDATNTGSGTDESPAPSAAEQDDGQSDQTATEQDDGQGQQARGIASKNGQHIIPYEVLEAERAEARRLREEVEQMRAASAERDKLQALLEKNGIAAESDELTMEQIEQLAEDYPDVGKALVGIARKLQTMEQAAAPAANPVLDALDAVPDLKAWQDGDPDRFTFAITVDDQLKSDPAFADKPLAERFAEAARRTRAAFGDAVAPARAETKADAKAEPQAKDVDLIPRSPSQVGQTVQSPTSQAERYQAMSQEQLMAEMSSMTPAQIEALLSEQGL
ncbi:hypothetical protein HNR62_001038 [Oceanisphaera litoralis]|uniref:hypothetical protein n=1 Tax=Oceanisphaera litoralis TaxID=225144 RepID=UPI00195BD24B|nr:hypothetical protein [Oceanisphaera litoralis]MBM7455178.1 hypothetical protein [Oceanisphaera litoralis]